MTKQNHKQDMSVVKLKNLGAKTASRLKLVGITTIGDLNRVGAVAAYCRLKRLNPSFMSLLGLYAMQAGLMGIHWLDLPEEVKSDLKNTADKELAK